MNKLSKEKPKKKEKAKIYLESSFGKMDRRRKAIRGVILRRADQKRNKPSC